MKKLQFIIIAAILASCSKESDLVVNEVKNAKQLHGSEEYFEIGVLNANGSGTITYNLQDLEEICACAVSQNQSDILGIDQVEGLDGEDDTYFLSGRASGNDGQTSFSVKLELEGTNLVWVNMASIYTCESPEGSDPCNLTLIDDEQYMCEGSASSQCSSSTIGEGGTGTYAECTNWPWVVNQQDKDKD